MATDPISRRNEGPVCVLTLDRPPVNALNLDLYRRLLAILDEIAADTAIRVVVLTAAPGARAFSAGADIKEFERLFDPAEAEIFFHFANEAPTRFEALDKITIAAVEGAALGGGAELLLGFDFRVLGEKARIGFPEVIVGQFPGTGGTLRLPWLVGEGPARAMLLSGDTIGAEEALARGLASMVVPAGEAETRALALARDLAARPAQAVTAVKRSIRDNRDRDVRAGMARDTALSLWVGAGPDAREGYDAFVEKRPARFGHEIPPG